MKNTSLVKSARIITLATFTSRILGFIRDVVIAKFFGTGAAIQAFVVAFRLPNLMRGIVGEASTNAAVVPVLSRLNEEGKDKEFRQVAICLLNILVLLLATLTLLGELFAPYLVRLLAPGFMLEPQKLELAIRLTRWIFPYLFLIGLAAYAMAVLNSLKHFTLPAFAPCLLNLSFIVIILSFSRRIQEPVLSLAYAVLIGGVLQLLIQLPLLIQKGLFRNFRFCFVHPQVKRMGRLFLPRTLGIAVYQANVFIDTILASFAQIVGGGAVAALYYANRIVQFPLALFAIALAQVALPTMSGLALKKDFAQLRETVSFSLRSIFTMMVPSTVGLVVLSRPLIKIIFERGSFESYSTDITSFALLFYCLALTGYAGIKMLASCFYALEDTKTPVKAASWALLINLILNLILMWPLKVGGLALATAISVSVNFMLLLGAFKKRIGKLDGLTSCLGRVCLASLVMGSVLWFLFYRYQATLEINLLPIKLVASIIVAILVYFGTLKLIAPDEARIFSQWVSKRK